MKQSIIIILLLIVISVIIWVVSGDDTDTAVTTSNTNLATGEVNQNQTINDSTEGITASLLRSTAPTEPQYETNTTGDQCIVIDLNDYIPTKDETANTYTWVIEFPSDDCVIEKPATNLNEQLGEKLSESIQGTNYRRITVSYE